MITQKKYSHNSHIFHTYRESILFAVVGILISILRKLHKLATYIPAHRSAEFMASSQGRIHLDKMFVIDGLDQGRYHWL